MAKRIKQVGPAIKTREEMEEIVARICALTTDRDLKTVQMDAYIQEVRDRYQADLIEIGKRLESLMALAKDWAEANSAAFGPAKSIAMTHGTVGFRTGMPRLKTLRGWTWDRVLEVLRRPTLAHYIRIKEEVDKEQLLAMRQTVDLSLMGLQVAQDESFYVDPNREPQEEARQERKAS